jgi:hypothetical protein
MGIENAEAPGCYTEHGVSGYGVAVKLSCDKPMSEAFIKKMAEKMMLSIAEKCMDLGARCIGHIKSHVESRAGDIKADTIGAGHGAYSTGKLTGPVMHLHMAVNSIVQGIPEETVKEATLEGMHEVAHNHGLSVVKEKEHAYFDAFDFMASKEAYQKELEAQFAETGSPDLNEEA